MASFSPPRRGDRSETSSRSSLHANDANATLLSAADHANNELTAGRRVDIAKMPPALASLFNPAVQPFLISSFALDPAELAAKTKLPILILQGKRDMQVSVADAERLEQSASLKQVKSNEPAATLAT